MTFFPSKNIHGTEKAWLCYLPATASDGSGGYRSEQGENLCQSHQYFLADSHTSELQILSSRGRKQTGKHRTLLGLHWFTSPSSPFADLSSLTKVLEAKHHQGLSPFL